MNRRASDHESSDYSLRRGLDPDAPASQRKVMVLPRWTGLVKYALFAFFSVVAFVSGLPSLDFASPAGYRPFWAAALLLGSVGAFIGLARETGDSDRGKWSTLERYSCAVIMAFIGAYIYAIAVPALEGDQARQGNAVLLIIVFMFPLSRWWELSVMKGQRPPKQKAPAQ